MAKQRNTKGQFVAGNAAGKQFSADYQPESNGRPNGTRAWRDVLGEMMPEDGYLKFEKVEVVDKKGNPTGQVIPAVRVKMPTQQMIVMAAIKQAMAGKVQAMRLIFERMDGKPTQPITGSLKVNPWDGMSDEELDEYIKRAQEIGTDE